MYRRLFVTAVALVATAVSGCARPDQLAAAQPTRPAPHGASPSPSRPSLACSATGAQLRTGEVDAAMGLRAMDVDLTNCGTDTIVLNGYPAARLFDKDHDAITVTVNEGVGVVTPLPPWDGPPATVTLRPGDSATSLFVWRNITEAGPEPPASAVFLDLATAPGRVFEPVAMEPVIDLGTTGLLGVSPWVATPPGTL